MSVVCQRANEGFHVLCYCLRNMYGWEIYQKWHFRIFTMYCDCTVKIMIGINDCLTYGQSNYWIKKCMLDMITKWDELERNVY